MVKIFLQYFIHRYVSAIHIPASDPASLISGGGDPVLKIWDWMTGALKHEVSVLDAVEPFMAVRALKRKRGYDDFDDEGEIPEGARIKHKRRKGKGKGKAKEKDKEVDANDDEGQEEEEEDESKPEKVLVIHKIDTLPSDSGPQVIFSAVGYVFFQNH
jgi:tRNA (guanine-N(7)-)-methyltransferase subunit TRM82